MRPVRIGVILIELHQVAKNFDTAAGTFTALKNVDLKINADEFVAVIGKSGSGKSTLINMIIGILSWLIGALLAVPLGQLMSYE